MNCLVVNAISTGRELAHALFRRGATCLHVATPPMHRIIEQGISPPPDGAWFQAMFDYEPGTFDALVSWAKENGAGRVLAGSEPAVETADRLADALGLPGNSVRLSEARRNKSLMGEALAAAGVPTPGGLCTGDREAALRFWRKDLDRAPAVVKPLRSTGGDGVEFCRSEDEVRAAVDAVLGSNDFFGDSNRELLIQREFTGRLFEVCTVSDAGRHEVVLMVETTKSGPVFDAMRLLTASEVAERRVAVEVARRALDALEIRYGAAHVEVLMSPEGPVVIEVAARLIGFLSPQLSRDALGTDQVERLVDVTLESDALNSEAPSTLSVQRHGRAIALCSDTEGLVGEGIDEVEAKLLALPSARNAHFRAVRGAQLVVTRDLPTSPGLVELLHDDPQQVESDHAEIRRLERAGLWRLAVE